ncbi:high mobility group box domain-containing protein, partial [Entophlyctis helioformis]
MSTLHSPVQARSASASAKKGGAAKRERPKTHTPRPANSFILYRREKHIEIMAQYKGSKTLNNNVISKIVADMWRSEVPEIKARYAAMADEEKRAHMAKYPDYKYRPRK